MPPAGKAFKVAFDAMSTLIRSLRTAIAHTVASLSSFPGPLLCLGV